MISEQFRDDSAMILEQFWNDFAMIMEECQDEFAMILQQFWYRLKPNATVVIIVLKWTKLNTALRLTGLFKVMDRQRVDMGDVKPHIVALRRIQKAEQNWRHST